MSAKLKKASCIVCVCLMAVCAAANALLLIRAKKETDRKKAYAFAHAEETGLSEEEREGMYAFELAEYLPRESRNEYDRIESEERKYNKAAFPVLIYGFAFTWILSAALYAAGRITERKENNASKNETGPGGAERTE